MDISFDGMAAIVTGAGKGIGRAVAKALAAGGATVHGISRTQQDLDSLKQEVPGIHVYNMDISDWDLTRDTLKKIGPVDFLVNNAGIEALSIFLTTSKEMLENIFSINTFGAFNAAQVAAQGMVDAGRGGVIINISSAASAKPCGLLSTYCMSKAALDMMTKCMALELGKHKIRVNSVLPGVVKTPMRSRFIERLEALLPEEKESLTKFETVYEEIGMEANDITNAVLYLLSDKAEIITGTTLLVDQGFVIA